MVGWWFAVGCWWFVVSGWCLVVVVAFGLHAFWACCDSLRPECGFMGSRTESFGFRFWVQVVGSKFGGFERVLATRASRSSRLSRAYMSELLGSTADYNKKACLSTTNLHVVKVSNVEIRRAGGFGDQARYGNSAYTSTLAQKNEKILVV